jgi:hypothetical protein
VANTSRLFATGCWMQFETDGTSIIEFKTAAGEAVAISIPRTEAPVIPLFPGPNAL